MRKILLSHKGFTLSELLLTTAILAFTLSAVLATFVNTAALNESCRNLTVASSHANFILEDIRNTSFASISGNISAGNWNWNAATLSANGLVPLKNETTAVTVSGSNLLDVSVTIAWDDLNHRAKTLTLRSYFSS